MANFTVKEAHTIHGSDPQLLIPTIIRERIYESLYWKEQCFGLNGVLEKCFQLEYIGTTYSNQKPTHFLCLLLKLLQIQPQHDILLEVINTFDFKMVAPSLDVYLTLEPLYTDYRKLRLRLKDGKYSIIYFDSLIDVLLREDQFNGLTLPRLTNRNVFVQTSKLNDYRDSVLLKELGYSDNN